MAKSSTILDQIDAGSMLLLNHPDLPFTWLGCEGEMTRPHRESLWGGAELEAC